MEGRCGLDYPISIILLPPAYPGLPPSKSEQVTKIVSRDVIGYFYFEMM